jgi:tetratricopeptide (TPR) repeat protein
MRNNYNIFLYWAIAGSLFIYRVVFFVSLWISLCPLQAQAADINPGISDDMAKVAALSSARIQAAEQLALELAKNSEVRLMLNLEGSGATPEAEMEKLRLLSYALLATDKNMVSQFNIAHIRRTFIWLFGSTLLSENYQLAMQMEKDFFVFYSRAALEYPHRAEAGSALQTAFKNLQAAQIYLTLLPQLYSDAFPEDLPTETLPRLEEASRLMPDNYVLLTELGRLYLWLEQRDKAAAALDAAIHENPDFAQSYSHRGALFLLEHKHALAVADFDRAIRLSGGRGEYYHGRAVVRRAMGDNDAMCKDLQASCLAGLCSVYEWAVAGGECRQD